MISAIAATGRGYTENPARGRCGRFSRKIPSFP